MNKSHILRNLRVKWIRHTTRTIVYSTELIMVKWLSSPTALSPPGQAALIKEAKMPGFEPILASGK